MILILIGLISGIISGMGIGGGTILIPALTIILNMEQKTAQAINLIYFIPTAVTAVITHLKANNIEISDTGINLKTDIEKVREQIQNIE